MGIRFYSLVGGVAVAGAAVAGAGVAIVGAFTGGFPI